MKRLFVAVVVCFITLITYSQGSGQMTINGLTFCHSPNNCVQIQSLTADWRIESLFGEPLVRVSFKWTAAPGSPEKFFDDRDFIVLKCAASSNSTRTVGYIRSWTDQPISGQGFGENKGGSPSWTNIFCDEQGNSLGWTAEQTKKVWKEGFTIVGVILVRGGGLDADKPVVNNNAVNESKKRLEAMRIEQERRDNEIKERQRRQQEQQERFNQERLRQEQENRENQRRRQEQQDQANEAQHQKEETALTLARNVQIIGNAGIAALNKGAQEMKDILEANAEANAKSDEEWEQEYKERKRQREEEEKLKEFERQERDRIEYEEAVQRAEKYRLESEAIAAKASNRKNIFTEFRIKDVPLMKSDIPENSLYFFFYSYNSYDIEKESCTINVSSPFVVSRHSDGTWPYLNDIMNEIVTLYPNNVSMLSSYYASLGEAEEMRQSFVEYLALNGAATKSVLFKNQNVTDRINTTSTDSLSENVISKFMQAEEYYVSDRFKETLSLLDEADALNGGRCELTQYLRILSMFNQLKQKSNPSLQDMLNGDVADYLKKYIGAADESKYRDISAMNGLLSKEEKDYQAIVSIPSSYACEKYLERYPKGKYIEDVFWLMAKAKNKIDLYYSYIDKYPKGKYYYNAKGIISDLDKQAYTNAIEEGTQNALNDYLRQYSRGYYLGEVRYKLKERIEYDDYIQAVNSQDYDKYFKLYPIGKYTKELVVLDELKHYNSGVNEFKSKNFEQAYSFIKDYFKGFPGGSHTTELKKMGRKCNRIINRNDGFNALTLSFDTELTTESVGGLGFERLSKDKLGFYLQLRFNDAIQYFTDDTRDPSETMLTGNKLYGVFSFSAGLNHKLIRKKPLWWYLGVGFGHFTVLEEEIDNGPGPDHYTSWAKNEEESKYAVFPQGGICFKPFKLLALKYGVMYHNSIIHQVGIDFSFGKLKL